MRQKRLCAGLMAIICVVMMTVPSFAAEARSSEQIFSYSMNVTAGKGTLDTYFTVTGKKTMDKIGCQSIYIYQKTGTSWTYVDCVLENSVGMSATNTHAHVNTISVNSVPGVEYRVVVTIFAENSSGRDTRTQNFVVTGW